MSAGQNLRMMIQFIQIRNIKSLKRKDTLSFFWQQFNFELIKLMMLKNKSMILKI